MAAPGGLLIESLYSAYVSQNGGYYSALPIATTSTLTGANGVITGNLTVGSLTAPALNPQNAPVTTHTPVAINATASVTAAQVATGYITVTSASAVTLTMPTSTLIAAAIGASQGTSFDLYIDNTASTSSGVVTVTLDSSQTKSQVAQVATYGVPTFGLFSVAVGASGLALYRFVFSSATAAVVARVF